ncbi:MAG: glycosyltransferase family 4 protein, partial [Mucilaginibacter sp.]
IMFALAKKNTVINVCQINYQGEQVYNGVRYCFVNFTSKYTYFPRKFNRFVKSLDPDVAFVQGMHTPLQLIQLKVMLGSKTRIIVQHHAEKPFTGIKKYLQRFAGRFIDAYLFASHEIGLNWVQKGNIASPQKIHEVMEVSSVFKPMDKSEARKKTGATDGIIFLWVGRLNDNKDPLTVVKAFVRFAESQPNVRLYMIYHTEELLPEIRELLSSLIQKDAVKLIGKVLHSELQYWFNSADIILSGSHYEGSGTAICEAMSCGCMPLVTDIPSFRMITNNGKCGLLYEPGNEDALLAALEQTQYIDIKEKQAESLNYFKSNLSFEAIAKKIQAIAGSL